MSSGLMASAQKRMQQKRERASQAKVASPSYASPSSPGVASPIYNNDSGTKQHNGMKPQMNLQPDFMLSEQQYANSPQYNDNYNAHYQQNYSPSSPMQGEEQFAVQHRVNYNHHHTSAKNTPSPSSSRPRNGYGSYTDASREDQEIRLNQQYYYNGSNMAQAPPPPPPPPPPQRHQGFSPVTNSNNASPSHPYYQNSQDENMMDGGEYEYDITEDDEDEFVDERNDTFDPTPVTNQGRRTPVFSQPVDEEDKTISSELALNGDPSKKKERKSSKSKKKVKNDARYLIHNMEDDDSLEKSLDENVGASPDRQYNYGDIAAHAGRYAAAAAASEPETLAPKPNKATTTNPFDDDDSSPSSPNKGRQLPMRIGNATSWDDAGSKQRTTWEDDNSSNTMQKFDRNSKSWDQENKTSFEQNLWAGSFFGESGSQSKQNDDQSPNVQALTEWDKADAGWQNSASSPAQAQEEEPKDRELASILDKKYPWKAQQQKPGPAEYAGPTEDNMPASDAEDSDGDSLFRFENKNQDHSTPNAKNTTADPNETFNKISQGIHQAGEARRVAQSQNLQRAQRDESAERSAAYRGRPTAAPSRNVAFAGEEGNKVHTYHVQQDRDNSVSDSGTYETREEDEDDETDGETLEDGDTIDNYTLDDATYGESTVGGTTIDTARKVEDDTNILDHVDNAVKAIGSALGGMLLFANNAATSLSADNDDTKGTSTIGQESEESKDKTTSEYDWIGYMEKFLFPETEDGASDAQGGSTSMSTLRTNSNTASAEEEEDSDGYLLQQAVASARAIHHIHGIQFDESQEINVLTDIKFVVVTIKLPLGLLFQEHELGAWVSRVVPDGNGARKEIQPGDQLAAINGKSSAHATIDEVAAIISGTPQNEGVELTFIRYVGQLRPVPGAVIQEGFEVTDKNVSATGKKKKGIFGKKKGNQTTSNKATLDFAPNRKRVNKNLNISMIQEHTKTNQSTDVKSPQRNKGKSTFKKIFGGKKKS